MKVYFINPPYKSEYGKFSREQRSPAITKSRTVYYPLWLMYAAAVVRKEGFEVAFLDAPAKQMGIKESYDVVASNCQGTRLFVIDTSTPSIYNDVEFAAGLKDRFQNSFVVLVGTHVSALPNETLELNEKIDAVARHEYDYIVRDLSIAIRDNRDLSAVRGLTYRWEGNIKSNPDMPFIEDLDDIPFAAEFIKEFLDEKDYFFSPSTYPEIQIFTGRGCPFRCNYCVYPQVMHGHKYRLRSAENVVQEFMYIAENFPDVKEVVIEDDTFTASRERVEEICHKLIDKRLNKRLRWLCNARVNTADYELMLLMKKAGCRLLIPGIESGNQNILNNIKKGTRIEQYEPYVKNAKKAGLLVHACYMVGNEGETKETMQDTLELALKLDTDTAQFFPLMPYPGTEAYDWAKSNGYIEGNYSDYNKENGDHNTVLNMPHLTTQEMNEFCDMARKKYYLRPKYIFHRLWVGIRDPEDLKRSLKAFGRIRKYLFKK
ncbi:B12-binding domain-containing radical SAM protein [Butyrivibrio proteoclasticus]|uniref:B12-binding domain-containing radical SAM protein n=1 Tax=Butyrivibrio proteoclasticus TaxID=43305 RepID=UPI00047D1E8C|nr:radical SAM protein [Butyrivibrio proteoclasticus]